MLKEYGNNSKQFKCNKDNIIFYSNIMLVYMTLIINVNAQYAIIIFAIFVYVIVKLNILHVV